MKFPFYEDISNDELIRTFKNNVGEDSLVWHRDREDRFLESIGETNWKIQIDNELPKNLNEGMFIPKGVWHRLIKGSGDLKLKIIKF